MRIRCKKLLFLSLLLLSCGCASIPDPGEPYGYLNPEGSIYYIYIDGRKHYTGFGNGFHTIDIRVKAGIHRLGYENNRLGRWTDLFIPANIKEDRILILEVEPGMRYYIGPEKREEKGGYIFKPVVKKEEKIL